MSLRCVLLVVLAICLSPLTSVAEEDPKKPGAIPNLAKLDPELQKKIDEAITKGAEWLASLQYKDGSYRMPKGQAPSIFQADQRKIGLASLVLYTLAHCDYGPKHKVVKKTVAYLKKRYDELYKGVHLREATTYSLSIAVLALHRLYATPPTGEDIEKVDRYGNKTKQGRNPCDYPKWVKRVIFEILDWLVEHRHEKGVWRYPGGLPAGQQGAPPRSAAGGEGHQAWTQLWRTRGSLHDPVRAAGHLGRHPLRLRDPEGDVDRGRGASPRVAGQGRRGSRSPSGSAPAGGRARAGRSLREAQATGR
jgi:hypothetical protein